MTQIGNVYAQALYGLARDEGLDGEILEQMRTLNQAFSENPDFLRLLSAPNLSKEERCRILDESFARNLQPYLLNFLKLLTEKGYIRHFSDCCQAYQELYQDAHGILPVRVVTAVALTQEQSRRLADKLSRMTGKTIELNPTVDAACMGGVRLDYDGRRVDDTVRHRLDAMHSLLENTVL